MDEAKTNNKVLVFCNEESKCIFGLWWHKWPISNSIIEFLGSQFFDTTLLCFVVKSNTSKVYYILILFFFFAALFSFYLAHEQKLLSYLDDESAIFKCLSLLVFHTNQFPILSRNFALSRSDIRESSFCGVGHPALPCRPSPWSSFEWQCTSCTSLAAYPSRTRCRVGCHTGSLWRHRIPKRPCTCDMWGNWEVVKIRSSLKLYHYCQI